ADKPLMSEMRAKQQSAPLLFTENRGQVVNADGSPRHDILFTAHSGATKVFISATGIYYQFMKAIYPHAYDSPQVYVNTDHKKRGEAEPQMTSQSYRFSVSLAGANAHPTVRREGKSQYVENFYLAQCPDGITNVATYEKIVCENVYPNIDWVIYSNGQ